MTIVYTLLIYFSLNDIIYLLREYELRRRKKEEETAKTEEKIKQMKADIEQYKAETEDQFLEESLLQKKVKT